MLRFRPQAAPLCVAVKFPPARTWLIRYARRSNHEFLSPRDSLWNRAFYILHRIQYSWSSRDRGEGVFPIFLSFFIEHVNNGGRATKSCEVEIPFSTIYSNCNKIPGDFHVAAIGILCIRNARVCVLFHSVLTIIMARPALEAARPVSKFNRKCCVSFSSFYIHWSISRLLGSSIFTCSFVHVSTEPLVLTNSLLPVPFEVPARLFPNK